MFWLISWFLFSTCFSHVFANSLDACPQYDNNYANQPPIEGFLRHLCEPGYYEGSCLFILPKKLQYEEAKRTCFYDYGGRLATAKDDDGLKFLLSKIVRDPNIEVDENTRVWIGYGGSKWDFVGLDSNNILDSTFYGIEFWEKVFGKKGTEKSTANVKWDDGEQKGQDGTCREYSAVLNPKTGKFSGLQIQSEAYALCEIPRWPKLRCPDNDPNVKWHLIPQLRMCLHIDPTTRSFQSSQRKCAQKKSFIAVPRNAIETDYFRVIMKNYVYKLSTEENKFGLDNVMWVGVTGYQKEVYTIDGTKPIFNTNVDEQTCGLLLSQKRHYDTGEKLPIGTNVERHLQGYLGLCSNQLSSACQRFADQSNAYQVRT